jgi:site-specific recombinase XerC
LPTAAKFDQRRWGHNRKLLGGMIAANPTPLVGRPRAAKTEPQGAAHRCGCGGVDQPPGRHEPRRRSDWPERDRALVLTALLAGLRADELLRANVGDVRITDGGAGLIRVRGKGRKDRSVHVEAVLIEELEGYLDSRAVRFPAITRRRSPAGG